MENLVLSLAVSQIPGVKYQEKLFLIKTFSGNREFFALRQKEVENLLERRIDCGCWTPGVWRSHAQFLAGSLSEAGVGALGLGSPAYPPQLKEIYDPPLVLYYRGALPDYDKPLLAMVGTRYPSGEGRNAAFRLAFELGTEGLGVVSGLARGIDLASHQGNLAGGGRTVAVLAGGLDVFYPLSHTGIAREILAQGGCLFSEYPPGVRPQKHHFPQRNRIISGLARSVVVVEAPEKSGALITADFAAEQGRDVYVHQSGVESPAGGGTAWLNSQGTPAVRSGREILADWDGKALSFPEEHEKQWKILPGIGMALAMEEELAGRSLLYQGEYFRRSK